MLVSPLPGRYVTSGIWAAVTAWLKRGSSHQHQVIREDLRPI